LVHSVIVNPNVGATAFMAVSMFSINGIELDTGTDRIFLPLMQALASNGGPGGTKTGIFECSSTIP
jgi:hypothetical protein